MNRLENWFCASWIWRCVTRRQLVPWLLQDTELGEHVLELGAGPGATTLELWKRAARVTSLEYSHAFAMRLVQRDSLERDQHGGTRGTGSGDRTGNGKNPHRENGAIVQGDASALPFPEKTFSAAIAVLVLHHLKSPDAQERAFAEAFRVLRPGGIFLALDIPDGWWHRVVHIGSTFVPIAPASIGGQLAARGFSRVALDFRGGAFRLQTQRPC